MNCWSGWRSPNCWVGTRWSPLDRQRQDVAAVELSGMAVLASTTAAGLARRFGPEQLAGVETAIAGLADRAFGLLPVSRRVELSAKATVDLDSTDVEVYGSKKQAWPTTTPDNDPAVRIWRPGPRPA